MWQKVQKSYCLSISVVSLFLSFHQGGLVWGSCGSVHDKLSQRDSYEHVLPHSSSWCFPHVQRSSIRRFTMARFNLWPYCIGYMGLVYWSGNFIHIPSQLMLPCYTLTYDKWKLKLNSELSNWQINNFQSLSNPIHYLKHGNCSKLHQQATKSHYVVLSLLSVSNQLKMKYIK